MRFKKRLSATLLIIALLTNILFIFTVNADYGTLTVTWTDGSTYSGSLTNNCTVNYSGSSVTLTLTDTENFSAKINGTSIGSGSKSSGTYKLTYTFRNPQSTNTLAITGSSGTIEILFNAHHDTPAPIGSTFVYASLSITVYQIDNTPVSGTLRDMNDTVNQDDLNKMFTDNDFKDGMPHTLYGYVNVNVFTGSGIFMGTYSCSDGSKISATGGGYSNLLDSHWGWSDSAKSDFRSRRNWKATFTAPKPPPPDDISIVLTQPLNNATYYVGDTIPFTGVGTKLDHIGGFINGTFTETQAGNTFTSSFTPTKTGTYTFQLKGRNTKNESDPGSKLVESNTATVIVIEKGQEPPPPPTEPPIPPARNQPPVAIINAPLNVYAGEDVSISGRQSYDVDGWITKYDFSTENAEGSFSKDSGSVWYRDSGVYPINLTVTDDDWDTGSDSKLIYVQEPIPEANIMVKGTLKQNRKVTFDSINSWSPVHYPIDDTKTVWDIVPLDEGITQDDIKYHDSLAGVRYKDVLFKKPGKYKVTLAVTNTYGLSDTDELIITVAPDEKPVANFDTAVKILRDPKNSNIANITLYDLSYSPDDDKISKRTWIYAYDSDNDGDYADEAFKTIDSTNLTTVTFGVNKVGKYRIELTADETFGQETMPEFIAEADYRHGDTSNKPVKDKIVDVINVAPTADFIVNPKKPVDLIICTDYTGTKLADLQTKLNLLKTQMASRADLNITLINDTVKVATQEQYTQYYHYERDIYVRGRYETYGGDGGGNFFDRIDTSFSIPYEVVDIPADKADLSNPPKPQLVNPDSYRYSIVTTQDDNIYDEEHNFTNWDHEEVFRFNFYRASDPNNIIISYDKRKQSIHHHYGWYTELIVDPWRFDSMHVEEDFEQPQLLKNYYTVDVNSVNLSSARNTSLRDGSDRYLLLLSDGDSTVYSNPWGTTYAFSAIDSTFRNYVANNNFHTYAIMSNNALSFKLNDTNAPDVYNYLRQLYSVNDILNESAISKTFGVGQVQQALDEISGKYSFDMSKKTATVLVNEPVGYTYIYGDYESDPKNAEAYNINHDPNYYDNPEGVSSYVTNKNWIPDPPSGYDKPGQYTIKFKVQDNPLNDSHFDNYKMWSGESLFSLLVHRRPIADFNYSLANSGYDIAPTFYNISYDLDHTSRSDKGIAQSVWQWKKSGSSAQWTDGMPTLFYSGWEYDVKLMVQDIEGAWSDPIIKTIYTRNLPPTVDADPQSYKGPSPLSVKVTADDQGENDFNHTNYAWSTSTVKPDTWQTSYTKVFNTSPPEGDGTYYLHMQVFDNLGQSYYVYRGPYIIQNLKLENLRVTNIADYDWKRYFINSDKTPTSLQVNGIEPKDMPIYKNKESHGIKLGYYVTSKIDTAGLNNPGDTINININYYALDNSLYLYPVDIYVPDRNNKYVLLSQSEYYDTSVRLLLDSSYRSTCENAPSDPTKNTWTFSMFLPPTAKVVKHGEALDLIRNNTFENLLLVTFDISGFKYSSGETYSYTTKELLWGTGNGSIYGSNLPTQLDALGKGKNHGEVFWYELYNTSLDDIYINREW